MLIGIPAILGPALLSTLRAMGHGDEIAIVDGNYPAAEQARRLIPADGHGVLDLLGAILAVLPIDRDVPDPVVRPGWGNDPALAAPIHLAIDRAVDTRLPGLCVTPVTGPDFYARVRAAHAVVATSEPALYGNVILRKGVIALTGTPDVVRLTARVTA